MKVNVDAERQASIFFLSLLNPITFSFLLDTMKAPPRPYRYFSHGWHLEARVER
jgi:hypothetical protein